MNIGGFSFDFIQATQDPITIPDCWVSGANKIGTGHGEAKLYIANKDKLNVLFDSKDENYRCFILKQDLVDYMFSIEEYYKSPTYSNRNNYSRYELNELWEQRLQKVMKLEDIVFFDVQKQNQIKGSRGYINSNNKEAYKILREVALGDVSYLSIMQLKNNNDIVYYWKIFADFEAMEDRILYIENYGKKKKEVQTTTAQDVISEQIKKGRKGQTEYRAKMLEECSICFITQIAEPALLLASHIKPYASCQEHEKLDPNNGLILSPLYDRLFDRGFITFSEDRRVHISKWLNVRDSLRIGLKENQIFPLMPLNEQRANYLKYHNQCVFKK